MHVVRLRREVGLATWSASTGDLRWAWFSWLLSDGRIAVLPEAQQITKSTEQAGKKCTPDCIREYVHYKNEALGLHEAQQRSQMSCLVDIVAVTSAVARVRRRNFTLG